MRTRVGRLAKDALLGSPAGAIGLPNGFRAGSLGILSISILLSGACFLLVSSSPAARRRSAGQHRQGPLRYSQPRHAAPRVRGPALGGVLRLAARVLP